jgi:cytochrome c biogenesis factor
VSARLENAAKSRGRYRPAYVETIEHFGKVISLAEGMPATPRLRRELRVPFGAALRRAAGLPRSAWGTALAHFGIGVTLLGIVAVTAWGCCR